MSVHVQLMRFNEELMLADRSDLSQVTPSEESWVARGLGTLHLSPLRVWFASPHPTSPHLTGRVVAKRRRESDPSEMRETRKIDLLTHGLVTVMSL